MIKRILSVIPAILLMCFIFYMSSQEATVSTQTSTSFGRGIILIKCSLTNEKLDALELEEQALEIDHAVRKTAHAFEYFLLSVFVGIPLIFIYDLGLSIRTKLLLEWIISAVYAASDEFHQYFVPGRSAQISDVILDSTGAFVGVVFIYLLLKFICKVLKKQNQI